MECGIKSCSCYFGAVLPFLGTRMFALPNYPLQSPPHHMVRHLSLEVPPPISVFPATNTSASISPPPVFSPRLGSFFKWKFFPDRVSPDPVLIRTVGRPFVPQRPGDLVFHFFSDRTSQDACFFFCLFSLASSGHPLQNIFLVRR